MHDYHRLKKVHTITTTDFRTEVWPGTMYYTFWFKVTIYCFMRRRETLIFLQICRSFDGLQSIFSKFVWNMSSLTELVENIFWQKRSFDLMFSPTWILISLGLLYIIMKANIVNEIVLITFPNLVWEIENEYKSASGPNTVSICIQGRGSNYQNNKIFKLTRVTKLMFFETEKKLLNREWFTYNTSYFQWFFEATFIG